MNLLSIHKFCLHNNCSCHFDANQLTIQDVPMGRILYKGLSDNGVYPIYPKLFNRTLPPSTSSTQFNPSSQQHNSSSASFNVQKSHKWLLWHHRLGHPSNNVLRSALLSSLSFLDVCNKTVFDLDSHCKHCLSGKMHQLPFNKSDFVASKPFELVHSDVWGPAPITSINDFRYYLVFVDDYSKFSWLYVIPQTPKGLKHEKDISKYLQIFFFFLSFLTI